MDKSAADNCHINPGALCARGFCRHGIRFFSALDTFWCRLERPSHRQGDGQTEYDEHDKQSDQPVWSIENGQHLRDALSESPSGNDVGDRNLVNIAPLQFGEETV